MSAHAAQACGLRIAKRAPQAQPVTKLDAFDQVRALICNGELLHIDMNVVQYLAQITVKETGAARAELATIAERIGRSRATVVRSVRRLIDAGVIEREEQRRGKRCYASLYRLVDPVVLVGANVAPLSETEEGAKQDLKGANDDTPRLTDEPTPVHQCTTSRAFDKNLSPNCHAPYRGRIAEISPWTAREWNDCAEWLAIHGKYARWGSGPGEALSLAIEDLDRWRDRSGDGAVVAAIKWAKIGNGGSGWFGDYLIERLENKLGYGGNM